MILAALTAPGYVGLIVTAFIAPFRMRGNPLRFAPLVTLVAWFAVAITPQFVAGLAPLLAVLISMLAIVEAILFIRLGTGFGRIVGICFILFAVLVLNLTAPYLYVRFISPEQSQP